MATTQSTPRVNQKMLANHLGRTVRLVGRVTNVGNGVVDLQASDNGAVRILLSQSSGNDLQVGTVVEIIGKVADAQSVEEYNSTIFNPEFNMQNYDQMINLCTAFPQIFGS